MGAGDGLRAACPREEVPLVHTHGLATPPNIRGESPETRPHSTSVSPVSSSSSRPAA
jgi:hypothetical protein